MSDLSVIGTEQYYGIQELSIEEIHMVSGGLRQLAVTLAPIAAEIVRDVYNNWDNITRTVEEATQKTWVSHRFLGYYGW